MMSGSGEYIFASFYQFLIQLLITTFWTHHLLMSRGDFVALDVHCTACTGECHGEISKAFLITAVPIIEEDMDTLL